LLIALGDRISTIESHNSSLYHFAASQAKTAWALPAATPVRDGVKGQAASVKKTDIKGGSIHAD